MSDLVKPGITKAMVEQHLSLLGAYNLAWIDAAATEIGIGWSLRNTKWDTWGESIIGVKPCSATAVVLCWDRDTAIDQGDEFESAAGVTDPTGAVRDAVRQAIGYVLGRWEDEHEDDDWHDEEAPAVVGEGTG